jgi:hypothetical protein
MVANSDSQGCQTTFHELSEGLLLMENILTCKCFCIELDAHIKLINIISL